MHVSREVGENTQVKEEEEEVWTKEEDITVKLEEVFEEVPLSGH